MNKRVNKKRLTMPRPSNAKTAMPKKRGKDSQPPKAGRSETGGRFLQQYCSVITRAITMSTLATPEKMARALKSRMQVYGMRAR